MINTVTNHLILILFLVIFIGIFFDIIGVAVTVADENEFHAKASKRIAGSNGKFVIEFVDINENTIDKINVVINTVTNHLILEFVLEFFSLLIFELVTLLFSATLFFELLFALLVELVESFVFVKFSLEDLSFLLI